MVDKNSTKELLTPEDVDRALLEVKKSIEGGKVTLKKATVDARAMGGATTKEADHSSPDTKRDTEVAKLPQSESKENFATKYPMDKDKAEGSALSEAIENSAIVKISDKQKRGLTKAFEKGSKSSASSSSKSSASSKSAKKKMKKAMDASKASKSSKSSVAKAVDGESKVSADGKSGKSATPPEKSAKASGSASGASRLAVTKSTGKYMTKAAEKIDSAKRHIKKAFEDGSGKDLDIAGQRIISANENISKAVKNGESIPENITERLVKAAKYFSKAIKAYENDKPEEHIDAVEKTNYNLSKALANYGEFQKSLNAEKIEEKPLAKSVDTKETSVTFVKEGDKYVMSSMDENTFKEVTKALNEKGLYKSLENELTEEKKMIDASPLLKGLVDKVAKSNDSLRDALLNEKDSDREFKKTLSKALEAMVDIQKQTRKEIDELKGTAKVRKSVTTLVESPNGEEHVASDVVRTESGDILYKGMAVGDILSKGLEKNLISTKEVLAWDVDKNYVPAVPTNIAAICDRIQSSFRN
jgi:hypothetical protein